jgi:hypothetical protein
LGYASELEVERSWSSTLSNNIDILPLPVYPGRSFVTASARLRRLIRAMPALDYSSTETGGAACAFAAAQCRSMPASGSARSGPIAAPTQADGSHTAKAGRFNFMQSSSKRPPSDSQRLGHVQTQYPLGSMALAAGRQGGSKALAVGVQHRIRSGSATWSSPGRRADSAEPRAAADLSQTGARDKIQVRRGPRTRSESGGGPRHDLRPLQHQPRRPAR